MHPWRLLTYPRDCSKLPLEWVNINCNLSGWVTVADTKLRGSSTNFNHNRYINHHLKTGGPSETLLPLENLSQLIEDDQSGDQRSLQPSSGSGKVQFRFHYWITDGRYLNNCARIIFPVTFLIFNFLYWVSLFICVRANASTHKPIDTYNSWWIYWAISSVGNVFKLQGLNSHFSWFKAGGFVRISWERC